MDGPKNQKYTEIQYEIKKKEKLKEILYDHDEDTVYVDSYRNISVALGEVTDLSKELKDKGFDTKEIVGGPSLEMFHTEAKFQLRLGGLIVQSLVNSPMVDTTSLRWRCSLWYLLSSSGKCCLWSCWPPRPSCWYPCVSLRSLSP